MPAAEDWVNRPQEIIQRIFASKGSLPECHTEAVEYFTKRISQSSSNMIPSLNDSDLQTLRPGMLVRFRCMIQDMFDPEYFLGAYEVLNSISRQRSLKCGMYKDIANCETFEEIDFESPRNITHDRLSYYGISVPGENEWVKDIYSEKHSLPSSPCGSTVPVRCKRPYDDSMSSCDDTENAHIMKNVSEQEERESKRHRNTGSQIQSQNNLEQFPEMNFPLPGMVGKACIVKLYDQLLELKMNDVVEFIGILSVDPALSMLQSESEENLSSLAQNGDGLAEMRAHNPPASLVPRLHAIVVHRLDHNNPSLPRSLKVEQNGQGVHELISQCPVLREELLQILTEMCLGDSLVAEYFLCHLISSVYVRHDVVALGKFCLNIMNIPLSAKYPEKLHSIISDMVTQSYLLPLSLENLNSWTFLPSKNYTTNRLNTGVLQLSSNTHLVVDETALMAGQLNTKGVKNMSALQSLIQWQRVEYDFDFHKVDYITDIPILILSEGKTLLTSDFAVPLNHTASCEDIERSYQKVKHICSRTILSKVRDYLTFLKLAHYDFSSDLQKIVENDFVEMRRTGQSVTADDLHSHLVLARLLSLSMGQLSLSIETWEKAKSMEMARRSRLPPRV